MTRRQPDPTQAKRGLLTDLVQQVRADLESLARSQRDTRAAATHEENRAEHAKDTRATEQSYLARGLADRVEDLRRTEALLTQVELTAFAEGDPIALTAIVRLADEQAVEPQTWWLMPAAGGREIAWRGQSLRTLTPVSPLGRALLGLQEGDEGAFDTPRGRRQFEVLEVC